jgi:hypothetical protein
MPKPPQALKHSVIDSEVWHCSDHFISGGRFWRGAMNDMKERMSQL